MTSETLIAGLTEIVPKAMNKKELQTAWFNLWKGLDPVDTPYIQFTPFKSSKERGGVYKLGIYGLSHYIEYSTNSGWSPHSINIDTNNDFYIQRFLKFYMCYCTRTRKGGK